MISKLLFIGDYVYNACDGKPMQVIAIHEYGFSTEEDYFFFDDVRKKFFLHENSVKHLRKQKTNEKI